MTPDIFMRELSLELIDDEDLFGIIVQPVEFDLFTSSQSLRVPRNTKLKLETNFLIFFFHTDLGKHYDSYFTHYIQNYKFIDEANNESAFFLK